MIILSSGSRGRISGSALSACALSLFVGAFFLPVLPFSHASAQQPAAPQSTPAASSPEASGEMAVKDEAATTTLSEAAKFRVNVKLVLARVVVLDIRGHAVGNLHKEDFELLDNGKPQVISNFDAEQTTSLNSATPVAATPGSTEAPKPAESAALPSRYVAYLFDDLHLNFENINAVRAAAERRMETLAPTDRAAVFSTSGQTTLDFTDDRSKLHQAVEALRPRSTLGGETAQCPLITFYQADLIENKHDPSALQTAINDYVYCAALPRTAAANAGIAVENQATQVLVAGEQDSRMTISVLRDAVRRIVSMPGQRNLVMISPGFLTPELDYEYTDVIDRAVRGQVIISTLDARGLYVNIPFGDASQRGRPDTDIPGQAITPMSRAVLDDRAASAEADILSVLAYSTGGNFFHNNNDMDEGFRRVADSPEYYYVLGFTPQNLKLDGKFHSLKVSLKVHGKYDLQVRRGYFAPRHDIGVAEEAKREIEDEMLSTEELHDLPVHLHTQFFKPSDDTAKLTVVARVDVKRLHYKQTDDRNQNDLTVVTALFDRNGNILQANQKLVQMRWKSETLQARLAAGISLRTSFDVKPGRYLVRVVARDTEQQQMSAENGAVDIP